MDIVWAMLCVLWLVLAIFVIWAIGLLVGARR